MSSVQPSVSSSPNRALAVTIGALALFLGAFGFFFAGLDGDGFFNTGGGFLFNLFRVNPAITVVWVLAGIALVIGGTSTLGAARSMNFVIGFVFLVLAGYGWAFGNTSANIFAVDLADNILHLVLGGLLVLTAIGADKENRKAIRRAQAQTL